MEEKPARRGLLGTLAGAAAVTAPKTETAADPSPAEPKPDMIHQAELKALLDLQQAMEEIAAGFARRMLAGATVEPGQIYADWDGEPRGEADHLGGGILGPLNIGYRDESPTAA